VRKGCEGGGREDGCCDNQGCVLRVLPVGVVTPWGSDVLSVVVTTPTDAAPGANHCGLIKPCSPNTPKQGWGGGGRGERMLRPKVHTCKRLCPSCHGLFTLSTMVCVCWHDQLVVHNLHTHNPHHIHSSTLPL